MHEAISSTGDLPGKPGAVMGMTEVLLAATLHQWLGQLKPMLFKRAPLQRTQVKKTGRPHSVQGHKQMTIRNKWSINHTPKNTHHGNEELAKVLKVL